MNVALHRAVLLRQEIEASLVRRAPDAFTPRARADPERLISGVSAMDDVLRGGIPLGAITELIGAECTGRTSIAMAYTAACIQGGKVAAWVDVDDVLDPESAVISGIDWTHLLWVRCGHASGYGGRPAAGAAKIDSGFMQANPAGMAAVPQAGGSPHPRSEGRGMPQAIQELLIAQPRSSALPLRRRDKSIGTPGAPNVPLPKQSYEREEQVPFDRLPPRRGEQLRLATTPRYLRSQACSHPPENAIRPLEHQDHAPSPRTGIRTRGSKRRWTPLDQALRATDMLLQAGGFSLIVLDLASTPAEMSWRIPLATWFRYRAACERTRTSLLVLTKHPCAKSSAELVMRLQPGRMEAQGSSVLTGVAYCAEMERRRFQQPASNVVSIRKPPQSEYPGRWEARAAWTV